jgi:hypothetical protein
MATTRHTTGPTGSPLTTASAATRLRCLVLFEALTFVAAAVIHFGGLVEGYSHQRAGTAETVIAAVLLAGLALSWAPSPGLRIAAGAAQAVAILGVLVGLFTIAIGVGPRTAPDIAYHVGILAVLMLGLLLALRIKGG